MGLEALVDSLLYEGYALYPYTPDAAKNATPTPFGIVYPPVYASECDGAHDHARLECVTVGGHSLCATIRYLEPSGKRFQATERRVELGPIGRGGRACTETRDARFTLRWGEERDPDLVRCCVHNTRAVAAGLDRRDALRGALISVHFALALSGGRFISPLDAGKQSVNTWPVLVGDLDDAILGAAIVLPDHPQIAPHSLGNLFDNTEIEEALALHVSVLTDEERTAARTDPAVAAMIDRTLSLGPADLAHLHAELTPRADLNRGEVDNNPGRDSAVIDGVSFHKGATVRLMPDPGRDVFDSMLCGRGRRSSGSTSTTTTPSIWR